MLSFLNTAKPGHAMTPVLCGPRPPGIGGPQQAGTISCATQQCSAPVWNFSCGSAFHFGRDRLWIEVRAPTRSDAAITSDKSMLRTTRLALIVIAALGGPLAAQVFDNSGNGLLDGKYYFREVLFTANDEVALYGNITFSAGTYTMAGAQIIDCNQGGCSGPSAYSPPSSTYSVSASGYGFISEQLLKSQIYGLVGSNGVFVGSSTESGTFDLFIAAPVTSQGVSTLQGTYSLSFIDPTGLLTQGSPYDALLQMTSNGSGTIGTVNVSAYSTSTTPFNQSFSGVKYTVSNNAFVVTFPSSSSSSALVQGQEYLYSTPDGSFVFGGSPKNFDMIVGVRTGTPGNGLGGLYYQAGMDVDNSQAASGSTGADTYYGSFTASAGVLLGHQRTQSGSSQAQGYTYTSSYPAGSSNYTDTFSSAQYVIGAGGVRIGVGIGPFLSISIALPAPSFSGPDVFLSPVGVVNSASSSPFTAGVSRGELITLVGTNIGPSTLQVASTVPFPTTLGGVQVLINNIAAPLYYVSSNQVSAIVPNAITAPVAQIQVVNNQTPSNTVTEFINATTPGIFTIPAGGIGYAAAEHVDGSLVTPSHPAQVGETIAVFATGLGDTVPAIAEGTAGVFSSTSNSIGVSVAGAPAMMSYAGLAPGLVGLYQINVQIPSGVSAGDHFLAVFGPDSYSSEALISVGAATSPAPVPEARDAFFKQRKSPKHLHAIRRDAR